MKVLITSAILSLSLVSLPAWANGVGGIMMVVKGDVKITSGQDGKTEAGKVGRKVFGGDTITSGADARAKIVMADKNILNISPDSKITIEKYTNDPKSDSRSVELKVEYGKVRATVEQKYDGEKNKFNIKTPTAVAGVRGTDFITGYNAASRKTSVVTFSGAVAVGALGSNGAILNPVFVKPGQSTTAGPGQKPETPRALPKDELNTINTDSGDRAPAAAAPAGPAPAEPSSSEPAAPSAGTESAPASPAREPSMITNSDIGVDAAPPPPPPPRPLPMATPVAIKPPPLPPTPPPVPKMVPTNIIIKR